MLNSTQATVESQVVSDQQAPNHYTDMGNARRLVERHGDKIRYVKQWGWLVWDGKRWKIDETEQIMAFAKETVRSMYQEASEVLDEQKRQLIVNHAKNSESYNRLQAMVALARSERDIVALTSDFNTDLFLITVLNGTIDLRKGELRPHDPKDLITKLAPVEYNPYAHSDVWDQFLNDIMDGNRGLINYLQRVMGYSLTGDTREDAFFIPYGSGRNGKSTLFGVMREVMGDYAQDTPQRTIVRREGHNQTNDLAALVGARLVTVSETEAGEQLEVSLIKRLTGGDPITARFLNKEFFTFVPQMKIFLATNNKPIVTESTKAIWARIKLIPFTVSFEANPDKELPEKLRTVAPAILAWMVQGCLMWLRDGLQEPQEVKEATADYQDEQDTLGEFFDERCEVGKDRKVRSRELYNAYLAWCELNKVRQPLTEPLFANKVQEHGYSKKRDGKGMVYRGISLAEVKDNLSVLPSPPYRVERVPVAVSAYATPSPYRPEPVEVGASNHKDPFLPDYSEEE